MSVSVFVLNAVKNRTFRIKPKCHSQFRIWPKPDSPKFSDSPIFVGLKGESGEVTLSFYSFTTSPHLSPHPLATKGHLHRSLCRAKALLDLKRDRALLQSEIQTLQSVSSGLSLFLPNLIFLLQGILLILGKDRKSLWQKHCPRVDDQIPRRNLYFIGWISRKLDCIVFVLSRTGQSGLFRSIRNFQTLRFISDSPILHRTAKLLSFLQSHVKSFLLVTSASILVHPFSHHVRSWRATHQGQE